jgi:aminopeptidase N
MLDPKSPEYWLNQSLINGEKALQQTIAAGYAQDQAYRAEKNSQHVGENLNIAHHNIAHLKNELDQAVEINKELFQAGMKYKEEAEYYQKLLTKPMAEIAQANRSFKETYEKQMELLADWMVSQKAFKELAIQFGIEKGLTPDEVHKMGLDKELDVLENKNDPLHKTNSNTIKGIDNYVENLKNKFHSRRK